jgi:ectoine hydroxylase-related dioxygenase (phytanoyl-CoA dioxygenase family)
MNSTKPEEPGYFYAEDCDLDEFIALVSRQQDPAGLSYCHQVEKNIPIYDMTELSSGLDDPDTRRQIMGEWSRVLRTGSGALVLKTAYADTAAIDEATRIYLEIIEKEKLELGSNADHFATAGNNDRIWNSLQKLCEVSPECFAQYFANRSIDAVCEAWLGPNYQMTAQVNLVRPGGAAQKAHRDYHLGFQTAAVSAQYPAHVHDLSPVLTLQGAVVHNDMPVESGPTKLLPFSQLYRPGYAAWRRDDFRAYFEDNYVQLSLSKGDALFFSPALFHGAGSNVSTDINRMANLLQISSAFGRPMETINRQSMCLQLYPVLTKMKQNDQLTAPELHAVISACAEGYSFPTNLDRDPPTNGLAPVTQHGLLDQALAAGWSQDEFSAALQALTVRQKS